MTHHCLSGKAAHTNINRMKASAHETSRDLNKRGEIAPNFYGYTCPDCKKWHLTKRPTWNDEPNMLVHVAAPIDLQRWAITGEMPVHGNGSQA